MERARAGLSLENRFIFILSVNSSVPLAWVTDLGVEAVKKDPVAGEAQ